MSNPILVVEFEEKAFINFMLESFYNDEAVSYGGWKCKVDKIKVVSRGSKQLGTYQVVAKVNLRIMKTEVGGHANN